MAAAARRGPPPPGPAALGAFELPSAPPCADAHGELVAAGTECGRVRVFDARAPPRAAACVAIDLSTDAQKAGAAEVTSVQFSPAEPHVLLVGWGTEALVVDTRAAGEGGCGNGSGGSNRTASGEIVAALACGEEEVSCVSACPRGALAAVTDDAGDIRVFDLRSRRMRRRMRGAHEPMAAACCWRGADAPQQLVSAGLDATLALWDMGDQGKLKRRWPARDVSLLQGGMSAGVNPPYVHALACDASARLCAAAIGDGSVCVYSTHAAALGGIGSRGGGGGRRKRGVSGRGGGDGLYVATSPEAHAAAASAVAFCHGGAALVSGGNDRRLALWRWGASSAAGGSATTTDAAVDAAAAATVYTPLRRKVNALAVLGAADDADARVRVAVADTGPKLKLVQLRGTE